MEAVIAKSSSNRFSLSARIALLCGAIFIILLMGLHVLKPDLDPSWRPISEYALGSFGWVMTIAFFSWGVGTIATVIALRSEVNKFIGRIGLVFLLIGAAGPILAGLFPTDPLTTPMDSMTTTGMIHGMGALLGDGIAIGAALITFSLSRRNPRWKPVRVWLIAAAVLVWVAFIWLTATMMIQMPQHGGTLGPGVLAGWPSRLLVLSYAVWTMTAVVCAMKVQTANGDSGERR